MLLRPLERIGFLLVLFLLALPLKASSAAAASRAPSLSDLLQKNIPSCAQSCLRTSLDERFPVACTSQEDVDCLCSHYSNAGESFGEVAVGCVYASCSSLDRIDSAYGICLGRKEAVKPTKTALTYTVIASSSPRPTTMSSQRSITSSIPISTTAAQSPPNGSQSALADTVSTLPSATASASSTPVPAAAAADASPKMTPAQIAGLSVAAVATFVMAIGLMALSVCLRRRRERRLNMYGDEKGLGGGSRIQSGRFSRYVALGDRPEPPARLPLKPAPVARKNKARMGPVVGRSGRSAKSTTARSEQRPTVGNYNAPSNSNVSLPLDQIGIAISAELDDTSTVSKQPAKSAHEAKAAGKKTPIRPFSALTQETVFEEDDVPARRRSSVPLPIPPVPIPPIRTLQPSKSPPTYDPNNRQAARKSELFLDIPVRHERPQPQRIINLNTANGSPKPRIPSLRPRLAPSNQVNLSKESVANTASSRNASHDGDMIDCYSSSNQYLVPKASPAQFTRPRDSPKTVQIKSKKSLSTVSHRSSRTSSNNHNRDSLSSQTSFETDPNDTTPEDDDATKQLQISCSTPPRQTLSPVAESPISHLCYPKVPRSTNQLVPRSPAKDASTAAQKSAPRRTPLETSSLLSKRNNALPPLLLESRPRIHSPQRDPFVTPPRTQQRTHHHQRSTSASATSAVVLPPRSIDRTSKVRSGAWGASPFMYEEDVVRPLNVRRRGRGRGDHGDDGHGEVELKSPLWLPRLTPTRGKEGDLWIRVG